MKRLALAVASLLLLTGCSGGTGPLRYADVYFVSETTQGLRLFSEKRGFVSSEMDLGSVVARGLVSGMLQPLDPDYQNLWGSYATLIQVSVVGDTVVVDLDLGALDWGAEGEARAIEQVVWTLTGVYGLPEVSFLVNGEVAETFAGHVDTTVTFERGFDFEVLNNVQITSITEGSELISPVKVEGEACAFEAALVWELYRQETLISSGFTTAREACPTRSLWEVDLGDLLSGDYQIVVWEESAEDGSVHSVDSKRFSIP
jgi:hypothetical protein